jgi:AcrR family transcriptional regulator
VKKSDGKRRTILGAAYRLFRAQGFERTSMAEITASAGGSKATVYSYFTSKDELFAECVLSALENYMGDTLKHLEVTRADPRTALMKFGTSMLSFICSPEQLEVRRLVVAESARAGTGKLFFDRISSLRARVGAFLSACMAAGTLRSEDPDLAAHHLGALLEAETLEPLLLHAREGAPAPQEIEFATRRAVEAFLRAYAPPHRSSTDASKASASQARQHCGESVGSRGRAHRTVRYIAGPRRVT